MTTPPRVRKEDLISRVYRHLDPKSRKKAITQKQIDGVITAFLAEIEASLVSGNSVILKNHFCLKVEISPAQTKYNPQQPQQKILLPELRKVSLRLSQSWKRNLNPFWQGRWDLLNARSLTTLEKIYRSLRQQANYEKNKTALDEIYHSRLAALGNKAK